MAEVPKNLEWSLPVPSVQELASQRLEKVPRRYIRADVEDPITNPSDPSLRIPLIDMTRLVNLDSRDTELQKLHSACTDWGVFQLINHGAPNEALRNMKKQNQDFFNLPLQEKKQYAQKPGSIEGYGQAFVISEEQQLEWCDMIFLKALPIHNRKLHFWPQHPQEFRGTLERYAEEVKRVTVSILEFAMGLGLEAHKFSQAFQEGKYEVRMNCYPHCPQPERVIGTSPHADNSGITLLLEGGDTPGLQFRKDGCWVFVEPIANAFVVNIGHIMEIMSNGIYRAPDHRAVVNKWKERLSVVTFCYPGENAEIGPASELFKSEDPYQKLEYKNRITTEDTSVQIYLHARQSRAPAGSPAVKTKTGKEEQKLASQLAVLLASLQT
ncbi:hypothetical protein HHK36_017415 [Tetracentron sinense]|uniref:Fe2OG dioxygenase domain-containing protein n=1 Tax=Tetracentron sinense TaxID=13715 RepID=A0A834Z4C4_TETSI|nr:hypothetical protein HHK36_017415 [Tetracentron sinense]